jgi:Protein of unknown function (DUF4236)
MGFRYRKSFGSGPFRMTISKRGIGYSVGGKHLRVTKRADGRTQTTAHVAPGLSYTSSSHRSGSAHTTTARRSYSTAGQITTAASVRSQQANQIAEFTTRITTLHTKPRPPATERYITAPLPVDRAALAVTLTREATSAIAWWRFGARRAAKRDALAGLPGVAAQQDAAAQAVYAEQVSQSAAEWRALMANDPATVEAALDAAFADHELSVVSMVFEMGTAALALLYPGVDLIPESKPSTTAAGRPTLAKRTKTERNALYWQAISSATIAAVLKALAAAPALTDVSVVVARENGPALEALYLGHFSAARMANVQPDQDPVAVMAAACSQGLQTHGQTHELVSIQPAGDDELSAILTRAAHALAQR